MEQPNRITLLCYSDVPASGIGSLQWFRDAVGDAALEIVDDAAWAAILRFEQSDVYVGWCIADAIEAGVNLNYIHIFSAGIDRCTQIDGIAERGLVATNSAKAASETIAETSIALMMALTRNLQLFSRAGASRMGQ